MANKKGMFIKISFCVILIITFIFHGYEFFYYKNELEMSRKIYGEGYYVVELLMIMVPISFLITVAIETSIYFNLHYFIIYDNKTMVKTVFNVLMLVLAVMYPIGFILDNTEFPVFLVFISLLFVMRILYIFIKKKY